MALALWASKKRPPAVEVLCQVQERAPWGKVVVVREPRCLVSSTHPPMALSERCVALAGPQQWAALADLCVMMQVPPLVPVALVQAMHMVDTPPREALWRQLRWKILRCGGPRRCARRKSSHICRTAFLTML